MRVFALLSLILAGPVWAEPVVVTDIAPIHSLTAAVMEGAGSPVLLIPGEASPHDFQLRPADAASLDRADLVIWVGPALTPWLTKTLDNLAADATRLTLLETGAFTPLAFAVTEDGHDHDHGHDGNIDPHIWLDPAIAAALVPRITEALIQTDPANAATFQANGARLQSDLDALTAQTRAALPPLQGRSYIAAHDALGYFAAQFDLHAAGTIADGDAVSPGPAHLAALRDRIRAEGIQCVLTEPGPDQGWAGIVTEGSDARTASLDVIGATLEPASPLPDVWKKMLRLAT